MAQALLTQLNHAYGTSDDCLSPAQHVKHVGFSMRRWYASSFFVQLMVDPITNVTGEPGTRFDLQYIKVPTECDVLDAVNVGIHPIYVGIEARDYPYRPTPP
jgi:hypothetical protein